MSIEKQANDAASIGDARHQLTQVGDSLLVMGEYAALQLEALRQAGVERTTADRIVAQWWSDMINRPAR